MANTKLSENYNKPNTNVVFAGIPIGVPFPVWYEEVGAIVINQYPDYFIKLSKDLTGSGLYNENKLSSQTSDTVDETIFYSALISDATSPLNTKTVVLINSTQNTTGGNSNQPTFLGAGETAQVALTNRGQGHLHDIPADSYNNQTGGDAGYTNVRADGTTKTVPVTATTIQTDAANGTPRTGKTTRPDTVTAIYYMRIK